MTARDSFLHITPSISRLAGGLFESVRHLSRSVHHASLANVTILALHDARACLDKFCWAPLPVRIQSVLGPSSFGFAPRLGGDLLASAPSLVHLHGLWKYASLAVWRWSRHTRRPYIVSPHGMLEPWALRQSSWKKRLALWLYTGPCLRRATCLRATSRLEALSIRRAGFTRPIAIIPNGVHCPPLPASRKPSTRPAPRQVLFLSRIHPKKGLLNLLRAWSVIRPVQWQLCIAGPDEAGHLAEVKKLTRALHLDSVLFLGEAWGKDKTNLFLQSDLLVLPSYSENFGLVIAEALACALPVITTRVTPWQELQDHHCGWWIDIGVAPLVDALNQALSSPPHALRAMGSRGRALVQNRYSWAPIGQKMLEVYDWIFGRREKPDCVFEHCRSDLYSA